MTDQADYSIRRGENARRLMEDPVLAEAFSTLEAHYVDSWKASQEPTNREELHARYRALGELKGQIEAFITDGSISKSRLAKRL